MMKDYLKTWNDAPAPKPCNDPLFIKEFIAFMDSKGPRHYEFTGENGYCGHTAVLYDQDPMSWTDRTMAFEFAYGVDFVKVFTANNSGFWVPEYINLVGGEALPVIAVLSKKLIKWAGLGVAG